jgi:hypothetical protein
VSFRRWFPGECCTTLTFSRSPIGSTRNVIPHFCYLDAYVVCLFSPKSTSGSQLRTGALLSRRCTVAFVCISSRLSLRVTRTPNTRWHSTSYLEKTQALISLHYSNAHLYKFMLPCNNQVDKSHIASSLNGFPLNICPMWVRW